MRLFAFTDTHGSSLAKIAKKIQDFKPDALLCCGDITFFGHDLDTQIQQLLGLGLPLFFLHGNHESAERIKRVARGHPHFFFMHHALARFKGYVFLGRGDGGFALEDTAFERFVERNTSHFSGKPLIVMSHGPPHNTALDSIRGRPVGCKSLRKVIETHQPVLMVCGHLHEHFGVIDRLGTTLMINPGPKGACFEFKGDDVTLLGE